MNHTIRILLDDLNQRPFKKLPGTRLSQFELLEKPAMQPLLSTRSIHEQQQTQENTPDDHDNIRGADYYH